MTRPRPGTKCARPKCPFVVQNRGLCKKHYPIAYPAHLRGDVDATHAREHIAALRARGVTIKMLFTEYGIRESVVRRIENAPSQIRRITEAKVLAIPVPTVWVATLADVDATGTRRRLQALAAIGYTQDDIAARIGTVQRHIPNLTSQDKVSGITASRVAKVFNELHMIPGPSSIAARRAKLKGWALPLQWDEDTIDDPAAEPYTGKARQTPFVERYCELRDMGYSDERIAEKMGLPLGSVERQLYRHGMRPRRVVNPADRAAS